MRITRIVLTTGAVALSLVSAAPLAARAQKPAQSPALQRGQYLVERVAMCADCHTPMKPDGRLDESRRFQGSILGFKPAGEIPGWVAVAPGIIPATPQREQEIATQLETGLKANGRPPGPPMPPYRLNHQDAAAVAAYLGSLRKATK